MKWILSLSLIIIQIFAVTLAHSHAMKITLQMQNMSLRAAILLIANILHRNVLLSSQVFGATTLDVKDADPEALFNLLLRTHSLKTLQSGGIYYIAPYTEMLKQQKLEVELTEVREKSAPLITVTQQIIYGSAQSIATLVKSDHVGFVSPRGSIKVDKRTNMIAIQDIQERVLNIQRLIWKLDIPVKQIVIEARIASVDSDCEHELGINFDVYPSKDAARQHAQNGRYAIGKVTLADGLRFFRDYVFG